MPSLIPSCEAATHQSLCARKRRCLSNCCSYLCDASSHSSFHLLTALPWRCPWVHQLGAGEQQVDDSKSPAYPVAAATLWYLMGPSTRVSSTWLRLSWLSQSWWYLLSLMHPSTSPAISCTSSWHHLTFHYYAFWKRSRRLPNRPILPSSLLSTHRSNFAAKHCTGYRANAQVAVGKFVRNCRYCSTQTCPLF